MTVLVFHHGWSFDRSFFKPLAEALKWDGDVVHCDAGYFGGEKECPALNEPAIGIGHSMGFAHLVNANNGWKALISIGGFLRFCHSDETRQTVLSLEKNFEQEPESVTINLHRHCDVPFEPDFSTLNKQKTFDDLHSLLTVDVSEKIQKIDCPVLALHGREDRVVPMIQSRKEFKPYTFAKHPTAHHGLGYHETDWCAEKIKEFLEICHSGPPSPRFGATSADRNFL